MSILPSSVLLEKDGASPGCIWGSNWRGRCQSLLPGCGWLVVSLELG